MKKVTLSVVSILLMGSVSVLGASEAAQYGKKYRSVTIEKNISTSEIKAYKRDGKEMGIKVIENPTFSCLTAGYSKANLFEKGTLYGKKDKAGNVQVGQKGDFKVYSFIKYFKEGHFCVEKTYEKGDKRYGKGTVSTLH